MNLASMRVMSGFPVNLTVPMAIALVTIGITIAYPVVVLFLQSAFPGLSRGETGGLFAPYGEMFRTPGLWQMWANSLTCAFWTTVVSLALGLPAGWMLARVKLPFPVFIRVSLLLPVMSPPYLLALAYVLVFQLNGLFDRFIFPLPEAVRGAFFSTGGVVMVMSLTSFGLVALITETALKNIPTRIEDAARTLGTPGKEIFRRITLPLLFPALAGAGVLVFIDTMSNFGVAAILGPRSDLVLLPMMIYRLLTTWPVNVPLAAAVSSVLAISAVLMVTLARYAIGVRGIMNSRASHARHITLSRPQLALGLAFFALLFLLSSIVPNTTVFTMSLVDKWQDGNPVFTWQHYSNLLRPGSGGVEALTTSAVLSMVAATLCVILGAVTAYALNRSSGRAVIMLDQLSMIPRVLPNLVLAVALILAWNTQWMPIQVYGTLGILVVGYVAIYQAVGLRFADAAIRQLPVRLESAALCLGAPMFGILRRIIFPILAPSLLVAWISIFVMCLRDWVASIMLLPPGRQTVGSFIFSQFEQGDFSQAMAMAVCTVVVSSVLLVVANYHFHEKTLPQN